MFETFWITGVFCTIILMAIIHFTLGKDNSYYRIEKNINDIPCYAIAIMFSWVTVGYLLVALYHEYKKTPKKPKDSCKKG